MAFDEIQLDPTITQTASGGPGYKTVIVATNSGAEQRIALWSVGRLRWTLRQSLLQPAQVILLSQFFRARGGRARGWRFKDWSDYVATSQALANPYPATTLQLVKTYLSGTITETRTILKPVTGTIQLFENGVQLVENTAFTLNYTTGIVTFNAGHPVSGAVYTWSGQFDTPVRFDIDVLDVTVEAAMTGMAQQIPVLELIYPGIAGVS